MADIHCTVITKIKHTGDVGEPGYSVYGEEFPTMKYSSSHDYWHGATQDALINVIPPGTVYMARTARSSITDAEFASVEHRISGLVNKDYRDSEMRESNGRRFTAWLFNPDSIIESAPEPEEIPMPAPKPPIQEETDFSGEFSPSGRPYAPPIVAPVEVVTPVARVEESESNYILYIILGVIILVFVYIFK